MTNTFSGKRRMASDKWLMAIGSGARTVLWAIGYFFGFTLVIVLSIGLLVPGPFHEISRPPHGARTVFSKRDGKWYVSPVAVSTIGWLFVFAVVSVWTGFLVFNGRGTD